MATAWPYPSSYVQVDTYLPRLTVEMNRADPFNERDATGWQFINMDTGHVDLHYILPENKNRLVAFDNAQGKPVDQEYQAVKKRIPPQKHY